MTNTMLRSTSLIRRLPWATLALAAVGVFPIAPLFAQATPGVVESRLDMRRAQATRAELEASLLQIDSILNSPGYSRRIREAKQREATLIRERLIAGDLQVGDQIALVVQGEQQFTDTFTVGPGRVISLPGLPDIELEGILRSEAQTYLTEQLSRFMRDPSVRVQALIRMAILGAVGRQGFYQIPAELLVSDAIMVAGGPGGSADPSKTVVRRGGTVLLTESEVEEAMTRGTTLDQLNLRAGDAIVVDEKQVQGSRTVTILTVTSILTTLLFAITRFTP